MHQCCDKPDIIEVYYGDKTGYRCLNCDYVLKPGEPMPEYYEIDEQVIDMFKR